MRFDYEYNQRDPMLTNEQMRRVKFNEKDPQNQVADNMLTNVHTIAMGGNLTEEEFKGVVDCFVLSVAATTGTRWSRQPTGKPAIADSFGASLGAAIRDSGWDMDSPEVAYMSGFLLRWSVGALLRRHQEVLESVQFGPTVTPEQREARLDDRRKEIARLQGLYDKFSHALDGFAATMTTPAGVTQQEYQEVLVGLLFINRPLRYEYSDEGFEIRAVGHVDSKRIDKARRKICTSIMGNDYAAAREVVVEENTRRFSSRS